MPSTHPPVIIGLAGGTGSGKTTVVKAINKTVGEGRIAILPHDSYYKELAGIPDDHHGWYNFDHPDAYATDLLIQNVRELKAGRSTQLPIYDFKTHSPTAQTQHLDPQPVILVEGILIFAEPELRNLFDVKIFVDTDPDIRFIRRLQRDIAERGRTVDSVIQQYLNTVRPMHMEFVEPSKRYADIIIPEGGFNEVAVEMVAARIEALLKH